MANPPTIPSFTALACFSHAHLPCAALGWSISSPSLPHTLFLSLFPVCPLVPLVTLAQSSVPVLFQQWIKKKMLRKKSQLGVELSTKCWMDLGPLYHPPVKSALKKRWHKIEISVREPQSKSQTPIGGTKPIFWFVAKEQRDWPPVMQKYPSISFSVCLSITSFLFFLQNPPATNCSFIARPPNICDLNIDVYQIFDLRCSKTTALHFLEIKP